MVLVSGLEQQALSQGLSDMGGEPLADTRGCLRADPQGGVRPGCRAGLS